MAMIAIGFIICLASSGQSVPGVVYFGVFVAVVGEFQWRYEESLNGQLIPFEEFILPSQVMSHGSVSTSPVTTSVLPEWPFILDLVISLVVRLAISPLEFKIPCANWVDFL